MNPRNILLWDYMNVCIDVTLINFYWHLIFRVSYLCMANFDRDQKNALMIPAKKAYGDVAKWDEKILSGLCNLLEALPVRDILKLASDVVSITEFLKYYIVHNVFLGWTKLTCLFNFLEWLCYLDPKDGWSWSRLIMSYIKTFNAKWNFEAHCMESSEHNHGNNVPAKTVRKCCLLARRHFSGQLPHFLSVPTDHNFLNQVFMISSIVHSMRLLVPFVPISQRVNIECLNNNLLFYFDRWAKP